MTIRPCERVCPKCVRPLHHSRFGQRQVKRTDGTVCTSFDRYCKSCQQIIRNEGKNTDRAQTIIERRAANRAAQLGVSREWMLLRMNWNSLVPLYRAMMAPEARCPSCGHKFDNERDIQIEHREPPRFDQDWARESARNIGFLCTPCNATKQNRDYRKWLDDMENARVSNDTHDAEPAAALVGTFKQPDLFDGFRV